MTEVQPEEIAVTPGLIDAIGDALENYWPPSCTLAAELAAAAAVEYFRRSRLDTTNLSGAS